MVDPITLAALIGAATSAVQGIAGAIQKRKANKLAEQYPRPTATMSPYVKQLMQYSYGKTFDQDIPGGNLYRNEIKGASSAGIRAASELGSGAEAYGMLGRIVGGEQRAFADQGKMVAQRVAGAEQNYMGTLQAGNQEWQRMDQLNNWMPYQQAAQTSQELNMSGSQNLMSAVKNIGGVATAAVAPDMYSALFSKGRTGVGQFSEDQLQQIIDGLTKKV